LVKGKFYVLARKNTTYSRCGYRDLVNTYWFRGCVKWEMKK